MMRFFIFLTILTISNAEAQLYGTVAETLLDKKEYLALVTASDVGYCDLPEVTRGDVSFIDHSLRVVHILPIVDIFRRMKTSDQFKSEDECEMFRFNLLEKIKNSQDGGVRLTLVVTKTSISEKGSYMGMPYCRQSIRTEQEMNVWGVLYRQAKTLDGQCPEY